MAQRGDLVLDGTPNPEFVGKPCAYCGQPSEGFFSIHRDGFDEGPEVALCIEHGGYETPSCEEIWDLISQAGKKHVQADRAIVKIGGEEIKVTDVNITLGKRTPTREQLAERWGCDCCGVRRYQIVHNPITVKLVGGPHPGVWTMHQACFCEVCANQRNPAMVVEGILMAIHDKGLPVKTRVRNGLGDLVYDGIDQWLREHDKGTAVVAQVTPKLDQDNRSLIRQKLDRGRALFGALPDEEE